MAEVIYKAIFSEKTVTHMIEPSIINSFDSETKKFIILSIRYAKKSKSNIIISKDMNDINVKIHIAVGMFFGGFKKAFLEFAAKSRDFLIFPVFWDSNFAIEISAYYSTISENE